MPPLRDSRPGRKSLRRATLMAAAALLAIVPPAAKAATYTFWQGGAAGFTAPGGTATWNSTSAIWNDGTTTSAKVSFAATDALVFGGTNPGTITLTESVAGINKFTDNVGVTLTTSNLSGISLLAPAGSRANFFTAAGKTSTYDVVLGGGATALLIDGPGKVVLTKSNTFTGGLVLTGGGASIAGLTTTWAAGQTANSPTVLMGTGTLDVRANGATGVGGIFTWRAGTTLTNGLGTDVALNNSSVILDLNYNGYASRVDINKDAYDYDPNSINAIYSNITYASSGRTQIAGTVKLAGGDMYYNGFASTNVSRNPVAVGIDPRLNINVSSPTGTLHFTGVSFNQDTASYVRYGSDPNVATNPSTGNWNWVWNYHLVKSGPGKLIIDGIRTYLGSTSLYGGTLELRGVYNPGTGSGVSNTFIAGDANTTLVVGNSKALAYQSDQNLQFNSGRIVFSIPASQEQALRINLLGSDVVNNSGSTLSSIILENTVYSAGPIDLYVAGDWGSVPYQGNIAGSGAVHKTSLGTLNLKTENTFAGGLFIEDGVITFQDDNNLGAVTSPVVVSSSMGVLRAANSTTLSASRLIQLSDGCSLSLYVENLKTLSVASTIVGGASTNLISQGQGDLNFLVGQPSMHGRVTMLNPVNVSVSSGAAFGDGLLEIGNSIRLSTDNVAGIVMPSVMSSTLSGIIYIDGSNPIALGGGVIDLPGANDVTLAVTNSLNSFTLPGRLTGTGGGYIISGAGTVVISGTNNPFTGGILLAGGGAGITGLTTSWAAGQTANSPAVTMGTGKLDVRASGATGAQGTFNWRAGSTLDNGLGTSISLTHSSVILDLNINGAVNRVNINKDAYDFDPNSINAVYSRIAYASSGLTVISGNVKMVGGDMYYNGFASTNVSRNPVAVGIDASLDINVASPTGTLRFTGTSFEQDRGFYQRYGSDPEVATNPAKLGTWEWVWNYHLIKSGQGKLIIDGQRTYLGKTTLNAGSLELRGAYTMDSATIVNSGTLLIGHPDAITNGVGQGDLVMYGGLLTGSNGISQFKVDGISGSGGTINLTNELAQPVSMQVGVRNSSGTLNNVTITGPGGIEKLGSGTISSIGGGLSFTGPLKVSAGKFQAAVVTDAGLPSDLGQGSASASNLVLNGGTLSFVGGSSASSNRGFTLNPVAGNAFEVVNAVSLALTGNSAVTAGGFSKTGSGTLVLSGSNLFAGGVILQTGGLNIDSPNAVGTGLLTINSGVIDNTSVSGDLIANNGGVIVGGSFAFTGSHALTLSGSVSLNASSTITTNGASPLTFAGGLSGSAALVKAGSGNLILSAPAVSGFQQTVTLSAGKLTIANGSALGKGILNLNSGILEAASASPLTLTNPSTVLNGSVQLTGAAMTFGGLKLGATSVTLSNANEVLVSGTFDGVNAASFTKSGLGKLTAVNGIAFAGISSTTVAAGELDLLGDGPTDRSTLTVNTSAVLGVGSAGAIPGGGLTVNASSTVNFINGLQSAKVTSLNGSGVINLTNNLVQPVELSIVQASGTSLASNFTGSFYGNGSLVIRSGTVFQLTSNNTYSGGTSIYSGTLAITSDSQLGNVDYATTGASARNLFISGGVLQANASFAIQRGRGVTIRGIGTIDVAASQNLTVQSVIANDGLLAGALTKTGSGSLTLLAANAYSGDTLISGGELRITGDQSLGVSSTGAYSNVKLAGGSLTLISPGVTALSSSRSLTLAAAVGGLNAFAGSVLSVGSSIAGSGQIVVNSGASALGEVQLLGVNSFTDGVKVVAGRLVINSDRSLGATGATADINLAGGALVADPGANASISLDPSRNVSISATGSAIEVVQDASLNIRGLLDRTGTASAYQLTKQGRGTLILEGNNGYNGTWLIADGTLQIGNLNQQGTLGATASLVTNNARLSFNRLDDIDFANVVTGTGSVSQDGPGYVKFTGTNKYSGSTIINSGALRLGDATYQAAVSSYSTISIGSTASFWLANVKTETTPGVFTAYTANTFPNYVTGAGDLHVAYASGATLNFGKVGSANNYSGATYVDSGTLKPVTIDAISRSSAFHVGTGVGSTAALDLSALGSSYSLANDQVLSGSGTVKMAVGSSLVIKGTLSPGGATPYEVGIGTLTIGQASVGAAPNVILQAPSSIQAQGFQMYMDIGSSNLADKLVVPGNISVAGKLILINNLNVGGQGSADTGTFDVVVATGTVSKGANPTGDLGFILDDSNLQGYRSSLTYTTNKVTLSLTKMIEGGSLGALAVAPTFDFGSVHVNAVARKNVPVKNTATGANPDTLDVSFAPPAPGLTATGSITGLATTAGTNTTDLWLQLQTSTPGLKSSNVQLIVTSVSPVSGQQPYTFAPALLNAVGKVYAYADPQVDATTLDIGSSHPNVAFVPKKITIQNNAPAGGYGESLQVQVGAGTSSNLNANGVILSLAAQATDSTSISAGFKAQGTAGLVNGSFTLDYVSINQPNSGLFPTALPSQTYNVVGRVYDYAVPDALSLPASIALGSFHVNDVAMQAVTVRNTASSVSGYSESLTATVTTTGSVRSSGSVDSLAPQASSDAIRVGINTSAPGALSGKANIGYTSIAFANSGLQDTVLTSLGKSINVAATVYDYAHPVVPATIDVGSVHVGEAFSYKAVNVQNQLQAYAAANPTYVEKLDVTLPAGSTANVGTTGSIVGLAAGDSSGNSLMVTLNTATSSVGSTTGLLTLGFNSKAIAGSNLSDTALSTKNITITGKVYALAQVSLTGGATPVLNLGSVHSGDSISAGFLSVGNSATASMYTETLKVAFDAVTATNNLKLSGMVTGLQAGNTDSGTMQVGFLPGSVGSQVGSVNLLFTSQALPGSGIVGDTSLGQATLTVRGTVYDYAKPAVATTNFTLPAVHVGGSFGTLPVSVSNIATASANTESLNASLVSPTTGVLVGNGVSGSINLAGQETDNSSLSIGLDSSLASTKGLKTGSANLRLVSKVVSGAVGLNDTVLANQVVTVSGAVYDYAAHNLPATNTINLGPVRGGVIYSVPELAVTNTGSAGAYTEPLKVVFSNPSQEMVTSGTIAGLAAGVQDTTTLKVGFVSGLLGTQTGTFSLRATSVGQAGLADTQLPSAAYNVTGTVYQVAAASKLPTALYLGAFHVGDDALRNLTIENTASSQTYGEGLTVDANLAGKSSNARIYGNVSNLAPGAVNSTAMLVGLDTAVAGQITGTVSLALTSIPKVVPLQPLTLGSANITVSADVYSYAIPSAASITLPSIHVGDPAGFVDGTISVRNNAPGGLYSEALKATVLNTSSNLTARSSQVIASANSSQGLTVNMATPTQGGQSYGTVTLGYTSLSVHTGVLGDTPLATQSVVEVRGNAYDYARGQVAMLSANLGNSLSLAADGHIVFNIGDTRVGGTYADAFIPLKNSGPAGQYTETLRASLTTTSPDLTIYSGSVDIAPQEVNASTLKVGFTPLKASNAQLGPTSGNLRINLTSLADAGSGLHNTTLDPINVEVVGNAYQAAAPVLNKPIVRLGRPVYGPYMALMETNARYNDTGWLYTNADPLMSEGLTLRNNTPAGTWSESLAWTASLSGAARLTDNGTLSGTLAPSDTRVLNLGLTPQQGVVTGTVHFDYVSKAAAGSTLQDIPIPVGSAADVTVRTVGYRAADWALPAATTVNRVMTDGSTQKIYRLNVGSVKTGQPFSTLDLIFSNTAPDTGGWTENLKVVVRNSTAKTVVGSAVPAGYTLAPITLAGGVNALTWGRNSSAGDITATFTPGTSGNLVGYFGLDIYSSAISNPTGGYGSSLGDYLLDSIIVELYGSVMDKATASVAPSIDFGATRVGTPFAWRGVEVANTGTSVSAAAEMINATIDSVTLNGQARGSGVVNLPATPGANINITGIQANLDVSSAGNRSGVLTVNLSSTDGTTSTALDPQTVNLYGKVYAPADPYLATNVNLGSFRMGSTTTKNLTIGNQAVGGFAESLGVTVNSVSAGLATTTLNQVSIAPGSTGVVAVGLGTGVTEGAITGSVRLDMQSLGAYGLAPLTLASSTVSVSATVYKPADPSLVPLTGLVNGAVDFGYKHQGATWDTKSVYVQNNATGVAGFVESLGASLGSFTGDASTTSGAVTVAPGATSTALLLTLSDKTAGQKSGTAKVLYTSIAAAGSGLADLALTSLYDTINVTGYMYSGQGVWTGGSGNWSDDPLTISHWTKAGGRPGMDGQLSIDFRDSATFSNGTAATITVDTANTIELTTLTFNSAAGTRLAKTGSNVGFKLNGSVTSGRGLIDVKLGSNTIETPISFDTSANDIKLADNTSLDLLGDLTSASVGSGLTVQGVGTGTLYASGHITVSNFTIDSGKVVFRGSDPLSADVSVVVNGGSLDLAGHGQTVANLTVKGGVVTASGASRATPSVIRATTFSKDSSGNAWLGDKTNREAVVIEGLTGVSQVNTGKLYNNAWFKGDLLVASGATLGGNGRSGAVFNYGTIAPGNSIDTYNAGPTTFYTGSTLSIEANQGAADLLNVAGAVTINTGANVQVIAYEASPATPTMTTLVAGTRHTIVSSTGAITGQFTTVAFDAATAALLPSDLRPTLLYGNDGAGHNTIDLLIGTISGSTGGAIGGTPFADYLQRHNGLLPVNFPSLLALGSGTPALYNTLDHIDLTTLSSLPSALSRAGSRFLKVVESDVFAELSASGASFSGQGISNQNLLTAKDILRAVDSVDSYTGTWTRGYAESMKVSQGSNLFDYDYTSGGVMAGIDLRRTQTETVGLAFGFSQFESKFSFDEGRTKGDGVDAGFYALHHTDKTRVAMGLSVGRYSITHQHRFTLDGASKTAVGETSAQRMEFNVEGDRQLLVKDGWTYRGRALADMDITRRDGFTESGAGELALKVDSQRTTGVKVGIGVSAARTFARSENNTGWTFVGELMAIHNTLTGDVNPTARLVSDTSGDSYKVNAPAKSGMSFVPSLRIEYRTNNTGFTAEITDEFGKGGSSPGMNLKFDTRF